MQWLAGALGISGRLPRLGSNHGEGGGVVEAEVDEAPASEELYSGSRASPSLAVAVACVGFLMVILDSTVVNVALPSIKSQLGGGIAGVQWVIDAYTLTFGALMLAAGGLSDRRGARACFGWGLALFGASSALCGIAPSLGFLIGARALQGVSAALMLPASLAIASRVHADPGARARAIALWATAGGAAVVGGPLVGGLLTAGPGWRYVFFLNLPFATVGLLGLRWVPKLSTHRVPLDLAGHLTAACALAALTFGLIEGGRVGFGSVALLASLIVFVASALAFLLIEQRRRHPVVPLHLMRNRQTAATLVVGVVVYFSFYGVIFTLSLYYQSGLHAGPALTGLLFLPMTVISANSTMRASFVLRRLGVRGVLMLSAALMTVGLATLALVSGTRELWPIAVTSSLFGSGVGLAGATIPVALVTSMPTHQAGIGSGIANALRQAAGTIGVAVFGTLLGAHHVFDGARVSFVVGAGAMLIGLACAAAMRRVEGGADALVEEG